MPSTKRPKPLYQRGDFKLHRREGRANLEIVWYDATVGRERVASAGTGDVALARRELDNRYLQANGQNICAGCGRPMDGEASPYLTRAIGDYLIQSDGKAGYKATKGRLAHVIAYVAVTDPAVNCAQITEKWVNGFREWLGKIPVEEGGKSRPRSLSHVEGCVLQLAAAINATPGQKAQFAPVQAKEVANSPKYRADVQTLAAMFRWCLEPEGKKVRSDKEREVFVAYRANLLRYLRCAVATWARPEEIFDLGPGQWHEGPQVLDLNPPGRRQTRKYRGTIPIPHQFAPYLRGLEGKYMPVSLVRSSWNAMRTELGLPAARGEAGEKLIRRSMATIVRRRIGEAQWRQGEIVLGHVKHSISDIYAIRDPANLGLALAATEAVIDEIEALAPGAFGRSRAALRVVGGQEQ